jgi:hypothetical protein
MHRSSRHPDVAAESYQRAQVRSPGSYGRKLVSLGSDDLLQTGHGAT